MLRGRLWSPKWVLLNIIALQPVRRQGGQVSSLGEASPKSLLSTEGLRWAIAHY